ncbi:MAG: hypothetical protein ACOYXT_05100 [Bacteroidota bacterium]
MALISELKKWAFGPKTKFKEGDTVQEYEGGPLMVVLRIEVSRRTKNVILNCQWYDAETKTTRTNLFFEEQLRPFDWNNP